MRILIKGGVWKNTEDEILKAAVMKYGKNQWARVSSLLTRKSAKQCKARWYEWLDPSIKKTEWSRDEEEKLLHLAKLMPNQWRTIAPIVGRTAGQCMEHYEKLLDQAQEQAQQAADGSAATDDPRRLRPGEIDPAPETKPARPDPIDMDEDEKEMLSEARARLANTMGKKAKRKVRERMQEEARRLSMLQKRRELKAAGVDMKLTRVKKRKYIDYAKEIPFQKVPPVGFYDIGDEKDKGKKMKVDPRTMGLELAKLEGKQEREEEEREKQRDKKRMKTLFQSNAPLAILNISEQNDPTTLRKRTALSLPSPQVTEAELEDIVKASQSNNNLLMPPPIGGGRLGGGGGGASTQALIGDYASSMTGMGASKATPMRTPIQEDVIMQEARNARILRDMTPMTGQEVEELQEGTGFEGVTPRAAVRATPNMLLAATPGRAGSVGATPGSRAGGGYPSSVAGGRTPLLRDQFGLNDPHNIHGGGFRAGDDDSFSVSDVASTSWRDEREYRTQLVSQLKNLPEPEFAYEIAIPKIDGDHADDGGVDGHARHMLGKPEDATEVAENLRKDREQRELQELQKRSTVLKRGLPRPAGLTIDAAKLLTQSALPSSSSTPELILASEMIGKEMVRLIRHDEYKYPTADFAAATAAAAAAGGGAKRNAPPRPQPVELDPIDDQDLEDARELINREVVSLLVKTYPAPVTDDDLEEELSSSSSSGDKDKDRTDDSMSSVDVAKLTSEFTASWEEMYKQLMFIPTRGDAGGAYGIPENKAEMLSSLATQFAAIRARFEKEHKTAQKIEGKLQVTTQGYTIRANKLKDALLASFEQLNKSEIELECFSMLYDSESRAALRRLNHAHKEAAEAQEGERVLQNRYAALTQLVQQKASAAGAGAGTTGAH